MKSCFYEDKVADVRLVLKMIVKYSVVIMMAEVVDCDSNSHGAVKSLEFWFMDTFKLCQNCL